MDFTSRMVALLGAVRRERNGAVADAMRWYGAAYGANYGVSLPTLRALARAEVPDYDFAKYLYLQQIRELRLAALHIAPPDRLTLNDLPVWAEGIINSEVAEEAAFALFSRADILPELFAEWIGASGPLLVYTALMAASRAPSPRAAWIAPAWEAVQRHAADGVPAWASRLVAQGAVALLAALGAQNDENRQAVLRAAGSADDSAAVDFVRGELAWRLEG